MGDVTRGDFDVLHARITEQVEKTATLTAATNTNNKRLDEVIVLLRGNGQPGLIKTVAVHDTKIDNVETDLKKRTNSTWQLIGVLIASAACVATTVAAIATVVAISN